jgi:two-component system, OmpR family, sensor histidine kinase CpxA
VRNATRYTEDGTTVQVELERGQGSGRPQAVVRVSDSGPGVPEDALEKIFRPFYRIDDARGRRTGGVGLGLAITQRAVRLHGGSVTAANRPGGGLTVEIRLPLAADQALETAEVTATPALQKQT